MKHIYFFIFTVIFLMVPANVSAQLAPIGNISVPIVGQNDTNTQQPNAPVPSPVPTLPIGRVEQNVQPTVIPAPTERPIPNPTSAPINQEKEKERDTKPAVGGPSDQIRVPQGIDKNINENKEKNDDEAVKNTISVTPTPAIAGPVSKKQPPKVQPKSEGATEQTPIKMIQDIIAPPLANLMQVKGANYYQDERLAPGVTSSLISLALGLFLTGMTVLKLPVLMKAIKRLRRKLRNRKSADTFTIPNLEMK
ncbi:MAG: hypothetical protein H0W89_06165 [Candidatus Levybacteria bacterium]|nr:hypothetical protein [Candidatus Levybacteria bacterium]